MKKLIFILCILGGLIGIFDNVAFYVFGTIFKELFFAMLHLVPDPNDGLQVLINANSIASIILCVIAMAAGVLFIYKESSPYSVRMRYIAAVMLCSAAAGLIITKSLITLFVIGAAAVLSLIFVISRYREDNNPDNPGLNRTIIIACFIALAALALLYTVPDMIMHFYG